MKRIYILSALTSIILACGTAKEVENKSLEATTEDGRQTIVNQDLPTLSKAGSADSSSRELVVQTDNIKPISIEWLDFETAIDRNRENPKNIFIDVYTDWCGWCKKMDASTFVDQKVVAYMNEHFYAVKMDAEMRGAIAYNDQLYEFKKYNAKTGYNTLAVSLLDSQMSFPSFVILDKKEVKKGKIMGYKEASAFLIELQKYVK